MVGLVSGLTGAVIISIFSTELGEASFLVPRTVPATAVIFAEPDVSIPRTSISRASTSDFKQAGDGASCNMPILDVGQKIKDIRYVANSISGYLYNKYIGNHVAVKLSEPLLSRAHNKITMKWDLVMQKLSMAKALFYENFGLACLVPRLLHPWEPIFDYARCQLGIKIDDFMEAPICNRTLCTDSEIEDREITNDNGMQNIDTSTLDVNTVDDCFNNMNKVTYGVRVLAKLIDDVSCDDPEHKEECDRLIADQRIVEEETCQLPR